MGAAPTVPLGFTLVADPLGSGLISTRYNPGGLVTGVSIRPHDPLPRQLELLKALVPKLERIAELRQPEPGTAPGPHSGALRDAASRARLALVQVSAERAADIEPAFAAAAREKAGAVVVPPAGLFVAEAARVADAAKKHRLATVFSRRDQVAAGGLASYGLDLIDGFARAARYVDRILRGAKPAELSVEQADRYRTAVNRNTAKALGLTISPSLHANVDEAID
jgi:putative ABC transport system substrate-binding protein